MRLNLFRAKPSFLNVVKLFVLSAFILWILSGFFGCGSGGILVDYSAYLDGKAWQGSLYFTVENTGGVDANLCYAEQTHTDTFKTVSQTDRVSRLGQTTTYYYGGPAGAIFEGIFYFQQSSNKKDIINTQQFVPAKTDSRSYPTGVQSRQTTGCGGAQGYDVSYGFVFRSPRTVNVNATLDGKPWGGLVSYSLTSVINEDVELNHARLQDSQKDPVHHYSITKTRSGISVPQTINDLTGDTITPNYVSGGPPDAVLIAVTPGNLQLGAGETGEVTFIFKSKEKPDEQGNDQNNNNNNLPPVTTSLIATATLDGAPWQGSLSYVLNGAHLLIGSSVPQTFNGVTDGAYTAAYVSGGPAGAELKTITTSSQAGSTTFNFEFVSKGTLNVVGLINNGPWSGPCNFRVDGPVQLSGTEVPLTFKDVPLGTYTVTYLSGGPEGYIYNNAFPRTVELTADAQEGTLKIGFVRPVITPVVTTTTAPPSGADLAVTAVADNYHPSGAGYVTYTVTITNNGPLATNGVTVNFALSGGTIFVSTPSQGSYNTTTGDWTIGTINSGSSVTLTLYVGMGGVPSGTVYTQTATVTASSETDPVTGNNAATVTITVA